MIRDGTHTSECQQEFPLCQHYRTNVGASHKLCTPDALFFKVLLSKCVIFSYLWPNWDRRNEWMNVCVCVCLRLLLKVTPVYEYTSKETETSFRNGQSPRSPFFYVVYLTKVYNLNRGENGSVLEVWIWDSIYVRAKHTGATLGHYTSALSQWKGVGVRIWHLILNFFWLIQGNWY